MALVGVNPVSGDTTQKKSALDNAATVLGVLSTAGNAVSSGYNNLVTAPQNAATAAQNANTAKQSLAFQQGASGQFANNSQGFNPNFFSGMKPKGQ